MPCAVFSWRPDGPLGLGANAREVGARPHLSLAHPPRLLRSSRREIARAFRGRARATMRWVGRLWRDDGRVKATPAGVAASLAEGVTRSTNLLRVGLEEQGLSAPIASASRARRASSSACCSSGSFETSSLPSSSGDIPTRSSRPWPNAWPRTLIEAASLRRFCWISRGFVTSGSTSIGRRPRPASRYRRWGRWPGVASRTLTSRATG